MSDPTPIETAGLTKRYGGTAVVEDLDLTVQSGETYGFLGPNGAGKSTTIGLLLDYLRPTAGSMRVLGRDPRTDLVTIHKRIGVLPDRFGLYDERSARHHVAFMAETKGVSDDPAALLDRVGLGEVVDDPVGEFSRGMQQRVALAMALVGRPELLILDEPFSGLDPHGTRLVREIVDEETARGATVFFSSHVLGQVELVCDRIGILHNGRLVADGPLARLRTDAGVAEDASMEAVFVAFTDARLDRAGDEP